MSIAQLLRETFDVFLNPYSFAFYGYLPATLLLACLSWWRLGRERDGQRPGLLRFLLPPEIYRHADTRLDVMMVLVNQAALFVLLPLTAAVSFGALSVGLSLGGPGQASAAAPLPAWASIAVGILLCLCWDFFDYWCHRTMHAVPALWEIHKLHHSAEVMTPLTAVRSHPVDRLLNSHLPPVAAVGLVTGLLAVCFPGVSFGHFKLVQFWLLFVFMGNIGAALQHSHVWLGFGPLLGRVLVSPAYHQLHHSTAPEHQHKNFGAQFSLWDWWFGTQVLPRERLTLRLGLGEPHPFKGAVGSLLLPLARSLSVAASTLRAYTPRRSSLITWALLALAWGPAAVGAHRAWSDRAPLWETENARLNYGANLLQNGDFQQGAGTPGWSADLFEGLKERGRIALVRREGGGAVISLTGLDKSLLAKDKPWTARVAQGNLLSEVEPSRPYLLSFTASASRPGARVEAGLQMRSPQYSPMVMRTLTLTDAPVEYALRFLSPPQLDPGTEDLDLIFNLAFPENAGDLEIILGDVRLREMRLQGGPVNASVGSRARASHGQRHALQDSSLFSWRK